MNSGPCHTVAQGGVGESGASAMLRAEVTGEISILMLLRTTETDLCPNTGVYAALVINGEAAAHGMITQDGASIQAEAKPGDSVVAILHTVPLFNEIMCVRLGELQAELQQCDLVV